MAEFTLHRPSIEQCSRTTLISDLVPISDHLDNIEKFINECFVENGCEVHQEGRVIALRVTDRNRLISAFKAAAYLGKYDDMANVDRFLKKMVQAGHSYEPIRGESVLFMYIGVGKPVYDHIITYSVGRYTRIAGGQRANLPWGYEVASETRDKDRQMQRGVQAVREVVAVVKGLDEEADKEQMQAERSMLPVGFIMPPFLFEFSEESLVHIFTQRLWEPGAQGATVDIVADMWRCCRHFDEEKWMKIYDHHGPHILAWKKAMRIIRDRDLSLGELLDLGTDAKLLDLGTEFSLNDVKLYPLIMGTIGRQPKSMWDKVK